VIIHCGGGGCSDYTPQDDINPKEFRQREFRGLDAFDHDHGDRIVRIMQYAVNHLFLANMRHPEPGEGPAFIAKKSRFLGQ